MFANSQMMGMDIGFPDVCLTPMPLPVPIPYPNFGLGPLALLFSPKVLWMCMPAHNMATTIVLTFGDLPGVMLGIASGMIMGPARHLTASFTVLVTGLPGTKMTSIALQNLTNCPGMRLVPSQPKVLLLAP